MCGVAGILSTSKDSIEIVKSMTSVLEHRGPDRQGIWTDPDNNIYLGHQRLSVVDLSSGGNQPMHSMSGRYCITYNGEIYNAGQLRSKLAKTGVTFKGHSDTEVIIESCAAWGIERTVEQLVGMFAFALWDKQEKTLFLVRDRLGIKPLYWAHFGALFFFGSELKALREHPGWAPVIDRDSLAAYLRYSYVPTPHSIYRNVSKLPPGCILSIRHGGDPEIHQYWSMEQVISRGKDAASHMDEEARYREMEEIIEKAVCRRMISDVPLGAFLSGGIDSSLVVALMQKNSGYPVRTFTIGFDDPDYNEAEYAGKVAAHLGTDHNELYVTPDDAMNVVPELSGIYDEPFADSSQVPAFLLSKMTRQHVTVALTGDGSDEVFGGYSRYVVAGRLDRAIKMLGAPGRQLLRGSIRVCSEESWSRILRYLPGRPNIPRFGDKLYKLADALVEDRQARYRKLVSHWDRPEDIVLHSHEAKSAVSENQFVATLAEYVEQMQYMDTISYLHDDILTKIDRASMAVSLEARVPLLDHHVVEHAWTLPLAAKIRNGKSKWFLRTMLGKYIPANLIERPKMGFAVPVHQWLRGPLREWAESLLNETLMVEQGFFDAGQVREKWAEHLSGKRNWQYHLWDILMFQAWHQRWMQ